MAPQELMPRFPGEFNIWPWLLSLTVTVVAFFLGWGLKDMKKRYDKVPEIAEEVVRIKQELADLKRELGKE